MILFFVIITLVDGNEICAAGSYLDSFANMCKFCKAGYYGQTSGYIDTPECTGKCASGYYCPAGSTLPTERACGTSNYYCPAGSAWPLRVLQGYYTTTTTFDTIVALDALASKSSRTQGSQSLCERGYWCQYGIRIPCASGKYGQLSGLVSANCTATCPAGHYCPVASPLPIPCPAGYYGNSTGLDQCPDICPIGHYCPKGSPIPIPCPPGRFGAVTGLTSRACSATCNNESCLNAACPGGYYCPVGTTEPLKCNNDGEFSNYCPSGSAAPIAVSDGYYLNFEQSAQLPCPVGFYCNGDGKKVECPAGSYTSERGLAECVECPRGYYCPKNSKNFYQNPCAVDASIYCPAGSGAPTNVSIGYFSKNGMTEQEICPLGHYCVDGVSRKCPVGTFGNTTGLSTKNCSGCCQDGYTCPEGSTLATQVPCEAGTYSTNGIECKPCARGYYCNAGSNSPTQYECGGEFVYCPAGSAAPINVPLGFYSTGGESPMTRQNAVSCKTKNCLHLPQCPSTTIDA